MEKYAISLPELRQVARQMRAAGLNRIELQGKNWSVRLHYDRALPPGSAAQPGASLAISSAAAPACAAICAPMPGKILLQHPLNGVTYAQPGQQVKQNDLLALVQVGALYLPVTSPADGTLAAFSVTQHQQVEYGSEVALLNPAITA